MSRQEVIDNLGTIARSGTSEFIKNLSGDQKKDAQLIGQFGVGFYSSFVVAERVEVLTRRAGLSEAEGVKWESGGEGEFSVESVEKADRGTDHHPAPAPPGKPSLPRPGLAPKNIIHK